jgi:hypothetical protein
MRLSDLLIEKNVAAKHEIYVARQARRARGARRSALRRYDVAFTRFVQSHHENSTAAAFLDELMDRILAVHKSINRGNGS